LGVNHGEECRRVALLKGGKMERLEAALAKPEPQESDKVTAFHVRLAE